MTNQERKTFSLESALWVPRCPDYSLMLVSLGAARVLQPQCGQLEELEKELKGLVRYTTSPNQIEQECMKLVNVYLDRNPGAALLLPANWTSRKRKEPPSDLPKANKKAKTEPTKPIQTEPIEWDDGDGDWCV